jgi:hypothetical protein
MKTVVGGIAVLLLAMSVSAQMPVSFTHNPIGCVSSACGRASVNAKVEANVPLKSVRVYFNDGAGPEYFVEMLHGGDWNFRAILPAVTGGTSAVSYRIVAIAEDGSIFDGPSESIPVTGDCAPTPLTEDQMALAMNTALGLTDNSQTGAPQGFSCAGLVKTISPSEVLSGNSACEEVRLANTDPCLTEGAGDAGEETMAEDGGGGASTGRIIAFTAAGFAVGAGGAIIYYENKDDTPTGEEPPISPSTP